MKIIEMTPVFLGKGRGVVDLKPDFDHEWIIPDQTPLITG
jgi:hypothetical protein